MSDRIRPRHIRLAIFTLAAGILTAALAMLLALAWVFTRQQPVAAEFFRALGDRPLQTLITRVTGNLVYLLPAATVAILLAMLRQHREFREAIEDHDQRD